MRLLTLIRSCFAFFMLCCLAPFSAAQSDPLHIVFLSGPKDHGFPGRHEYVKDLEVLQAGFEESLNIPEVRTSFYIGRAPEAAEISDADVIVILSSSDRLETETHPLFPPDPETDHHGYDEETEAYLDAYDALVKQGMGVVVLHYAVWAENWAARGYYLDWTGGLWVQMASRNPTDTWTMTPINITHPVLNGIEEWEYRDEVFTRYFLPEDYRRTDLVQATPHQDRYAIGSTVAAWALQREDGGRAFVFGGVDYHENMLIDNYRRFLLNGIYWAAGGQVPTEGIDSSMPEGIEPYVQPEFPPRR